MDHAKGVVSSINPGKIRGEGADKLRVMSCPELSIHLALPYLECLFPTDSAQSWLANLQICASGWPQKLEWRSVYGVGQSTHPLAKLLVM